MNASKKSLLPLLASQAAVGLLTMVFAQLSHATSETKFLWSDSQGFMPATACREAAQLKIPFSILDGKNTIKIGNRQITARALVLEKNAGKDGSYVQLIDKGDQGYVKSTAVAGLEDYVLEVKNTNQILRVGNNDIQLNKSFWQAAMSEDKFKTVTCGSGAEAKTYAIFEVFTAESMDPLATVGVAADEAKIFRSVLIDTQDEAEVKLGGDKNSDKQLESAHEAPSAISSSGSNATSGAGSKSGAQSSLITQNLKSGGTLVVPLPPTRPAIPAANPSASAGKPAEAVPAIPAKAAVPAVTSASAEAKPPQAPAPTAVDGVPVVASLNYVVCASGSGIRVRDQSLKNVSFMVDGLDDVKLVQSWGTDMQKTTIDGKEYTFIKVQVADEEGAQQTGWIASDFIKEKSKCDLVKKDEEVKGPANPVNTSVSITGLSDGNCCTFPTIKRPTDSYKSGMRRFGAGRSGGRRKHGACDLYRKHGEAYRAIANGTVIRDLYMFYQGVYALEVVHEGGFVVRYGETLSKSPSGVKAGQKVKAGQTLGYIGTVNSGCCSPMLHFEVYSGKSKGALTQLRNRPTQRRQDLVNPTSYLSTWEKRQFGSSY